MTRITLRSAVDLSFQVESEVLVLSQLTSLLPSRSLVETLVSVQFPDVVLADPEFAVSKKVDLLIGADLYGQLLRSGLMKSATSQLVAQNTVFGWIVSGPLEGDAPGRAETSAVNPPIQAFHSTQLDDLDQALQRFWEIEEVSTSSNKLKPEDDLCERIFLENHVRDLQGRYEVRLPLKADLPSVAAETRRMAIGSLSSMHRRFSRDPKLAQAYCEFMETYERLGHMSRVSASEVRQAEAWYLPHHAVVQESASHWKLRVVFDASRRTRDGQCLNAFLFTGPSLQSDISLTLLNWRRYRFGRFE